MPSLAVTITPKLPVTDGTPLITPVFGLISNPVGSPVDEKVSGSPFGSENAPAVVVLNAIVTVADCGDGIPLPTITGG